MSLGCVETLGRGRARVKYPAASFVLERSIMCRNGLVLVYLERDCVLGDAFLCVKSNKQAAVEFCRQYAEGLQ